MREKRYNGENGITKRNYVEKRERRFGKMEFRLAVKEDLPGLKAVYREIVEHMEKNGIAIWDEVYPCDVLEEDIRRGELYLMAEEGEIVSAFALCGSNPGEGDVRWRYECGRVLYLERLGVNVNYLRKGVGGETLRMAAVRARELGAKALRLFVVDLNRPAIRLYEKSGFEEADGIYAEDVGQGLILQEFGFERSLL